MKKKGTSLCLMFMRQTTNACALHVLCSFMQVVQRREGSLGVEEWRYLSFSICTTRWCSVLLAADSLCIRFNNWWFFYLAHCMVFSADDLKWWNEWILLWCTFIVSRMRSLTWRKRPLSAGLLSVGHLFEPGSCQEQAAALPPRCRKRRA